MPVIREYGDAKVSSVGAIQRSAYSGEQFGAAEGQAMTKLGEAVQSTGEIVAKRLDQENTSDVTAKLTKANADLAIDLQNRLRTATPGDKKVFEDYNQHVQDTMGAIGDQAHTAYARIYFQDASAKIQGQLSKTSADGQADLAGVKAVQDYTNSLNNLSAAAMADPSSVQLQRDLHKQTIENLVATGSLPREKALQLETKGEHELAKATMRGWIGLNPEYAKKKLSDGEFDTQLGADGKAQLFGEADQAIRGKEIEQERRERQAEKVLKQQQQVVQNKFLSSMVDGELSTKDVLNSKLEAFGSGSKEQFLQMMKAHNEKELKTDPAVMVDLFRRIHLPDGDPDKLVEESDLNQSVINRQLSLTDLNRLRDEVQGKQTEAGKIEADLKKQIFDIAKGKLTKANPMLGLTDPEGQENLQRWTIGFLDNYKMQRAKGKSAEELLSPDSPDYLGKNIPQYTKSVMQIMRANMPKRAPAPTVLSGPGTPGIEGANATPTVPGAPTVYKAPTTTVNPRKSGESAADYLKRMKAGG